MSKTKSIIVNIDKNSYNIHVGYGFLPKFNFKRFNKSKYAIITDSYLANKYIGPKYALFLKEHLNNQGLDARIFSFEQGEQSKNPETAIKLGRKMARSKFDRDSMIIALGGGVVGDVAGWLASFYLRGVDYIQIPTTLVAQVDSSIGGKTGVDIPEGKNLFGAFYQPKAVLTDTHLLNSLGKEETRNGLGEIIKYAVTLDENLFNYLERYIKNFVRDDIFLNHVVRKCCEIKARVVEKDEKESEYRKVLNYGHTIGHAIEASENYRIQHGDCVALGMLYEGKLANRIGIFNDRDLERQNNVISHFWPKYILDYLDFKPDASKLMKFMKRDKKNKSDEIYFVLPARIGKVKEKNGKVAFSADEKIIREVLRV